MDNLIVIHPTTLTQLDCKLKYFWSRNYKTQTPATQLTFGIAIHNALEQYYATGEQLVDVFRRQAKETGLWKADVDLGIIMLSNYVREYQGKERFKVLATEKEIARRVPVPKTEDPAKAMKFFVAARIDALVEDLSNGQIFVLEHKTFDKFYPGSLDMDHQFVIEKFVAEGFIKKSVKGVIYNGLRKTAKASATTKLFERHPIYINEHQVAVALDRIYWTLKSIHSGEFHVYPEPSGMKCNMCDFRGPCNEYMRGGDYQYLLDNTFLAREEDKETEWL